MKDIKQWATEQSEKAYYDMMRAQDISKETENEDAWHANMVTIGWLKGYRVALRQLIEFLDRQNE